jgi:hypothetical protein
MKGKNASAFFCVGKCWVVPKECGAQPLSLALALSPRERACKSGEEMRRWQATATSSPDLHRLAQRPSQCYMGGGEAGDGHSVRGAADVIQAGAMEEADGLRLAAMLTTDADL